MSRENVIVQVMPVWGRADTVVALTGVPENVIKKLYNDGEVRARKMDPDKAKSAVVFKVQDVLDWLDNHAGKPSAYVLPEVNHG